MENKKISIIWNLTRQCLWCCRFCCVDAKKVNKLQLLNQNQDKTFCIDKELNYLEKLKVIDNLDPNGFRIDFSGGELFLDPLNLELILRASKRLGKENIGVSTSGALINEEIAKKLQDKVSDVEVTMDSAPFVMYENRPMGYHEYAANGIKILKKYHIHIGVQTVITKENMSYEMLQQTFEWVENNGVDDWSILKFMPVGRGTAFPELKPSAEDYVRVVNDIKKITQGCRVNVCFQYMLPNHKKASSECRAVKKSIGLLPNGDVVSCFWALGKDMVPMHDKYRLGTVLENTVDEILHNEKADYWRQQTGRCPLCKEIDEN